MRFSFCEHACGVGPWHIREVGPEGLKFGGGAKAPLCRGEEPKNWPNGWDLEVDITETLLDGVCPKCVALYRARQVEQQV